MFRKRAFTLIELLVVIAIISLLVSILLPSLNRAKSLAKEVLCLTRQKQIGTAIMMYADQYGDYVCGPIAENYTTPAVSRQHFFNLLSGYVGEKTGLGYGEDVEYYGYSDVFICPDFTVVEPWSPGYGMACVIYGDINDPGDWSKAYVNVIRAHEDTSEYWISGAEDYRFYRRSEFYRPEVRGWVTDAFAWPVSGGPHPPNQVYDPINREWPNWDPSFGQEPERHQGRCNVLFANGNARSLGYLVSGHAFYDIDNVPQ